MTTELERNVMRKRQKEYMDSIKPFCDIKVEILKLVAPTVTIHPDGTIEQEYNFTPEQAEAMRVADEEIEAVKARFAEAVRAPEVGKFNLYVPETHN